MTEMVKDKQYRLIMNDFGSIKDTVGFFLLYK